jgi:hypothetical protein
MDNQAPQPLKPLLISLLAEGKAAQQAFIEQLSDTERAESGTPDLWSAKDHVAHNSAWIADTARIVAAAAQGETPEPIPSITVFNPQVFADQQHMPWGAVMSDLTKADTALREATAACSEAVLLDPALFPWLDGQPIWTRVFVDGYEHLFEHFGQFYLERGDVARATSWRLAAIEPARPLVGDTEAFGYLLYNLGCFYAETGQPGPAVAAIRASFASVPDMRKEVAEEPALVPIHNEPAFQELLAEISAERAAG